MKNILYSTGCPRCNILVTKLNAKGIEYDICTDIETMKQLEIETVPVLSVDGKLMGYAEAVKWVNAQ